jgi:hypothetical protein
MQAVTHVTRHWSCMRTCHGHAISASVLAPHRQGRRCFGWSCLDAVSVSASTRHQTRWRTSPGTGHLPGCFHGLMDSDAKEEGGWPGPHNRTPISSSRESLNIMMPCKKGTPFVHICKSRNDSRVKIWLFEPVNYSRQFRVVFLFLPSLWLFLVAVSFFKVFGD